MKVGGAASFNREERREWAKDAARQRAFRELAQHIDPGYEYCFVIEEETAPIGVPADYYEHRVVIQFEKRYPHELDNR